MCHEYTHLMVRQAGLKVPVWLNEGLAEIYSTFKPVGAKVQVGDLIPGHFYAVQTGWIPVERLVEVKQDSPEYNGKGTAQFYAEAWGLTHMLMLGDEVGKEYTAVLSKLIRGASVEEAMAGTDLDLKKLDGRLRNYLKQNDRFYASLIPYKSSRSEADWTVERIGPAEVDATLALVMLNQSQRQDEAAARMAKLDRGGWPGREALGYAEWRKGNTGAAKEHFVEAIRLGAKSAKLHYDAARMAMYSSDRGKESIGYLQEALRLYPEWTEAKLQLVEQYLYVGESEKALAVAREPNQTGPRAASRLPRGVAYAEAPLRGAEAPAPAVKRARETAQSEYDKLACSQLESFVEMRKRGGELLLAEQMRRMRESADQAEAGRYVDGAVPDGNEERPRIARRTVEEDPGRLARPVVVHSADWVALEGVLVNMECSGAFPVLRVDAEGVKGLELEMRDPEKINQELLVAEEDLKPLELQCGNQSRKVKLGYIRASEAGKRGQLRTIQYVD